MEFRERLRLLRKQKGITQEALGNAIHISRSAIAKWEAGLGLPNEDSITALCQYFNVERCELFKDTQTEELLVEKNVKIKRHKRVIAILITMLLIGIAIFSSLQIYNTVQIRNKQQETELLKTFVPTVTKLSFDHPYTNIEETVPLEEGNYVLSFEKWTKVYFEVEADDRLFQNWYTFHPQFENFDNMYLNILSSRWIEYDNGLMRRFRCFVYIRPQNENVTTLNLSEFILFYTFNGVGNEKECALNIEPLPITIRKNA